MIIRTFGKWSASIAADECGSEPAYQMILAGGRGVRLRPRIRTGS
jgi:hypothetical protein